MYYINPNIKELYRTSYTDSRIGYLKLDMNENPDFLPSEVVDNILSNITSEDISMYPETAKLIEYLAKFLNVKEENVCITNGSDDAIRIIMQVFGKPGSNLVSVMPTFEMYYVYTNIYGINLKAVNFNKDFSIDFNNINKRTPSV